LFALQCCSTGWPEPREIGGGLVQDKRWLNNSGGGRRRSVSSRLLPLRFSTEMIGTRKTLGSSGSRWQGCGSRGCG
jgi:hypothetical protein